MFLGIDLHKRAAQVAVRNNDGELIEETRVDNDDLKPLAESYAGGEALLEATTNCFYIYDLLSEYLELKVGHPPKLKAFAQTDKKTDQVDAKELSRLLWLGSVPQSYVPTGEIRECRSLIRGRIRWLPLSGELISHMQQAITKEELPAWPIDDSKITAIQGLRSDGAYAGHLSPFAGHVSTQFLGTLIF
jgi:hypothetical protein